MEGFPPAGFIPAESKIPGIEVYQPAPARQPAQAEAQKEVVEFHCPQCGATTAYSLMKGGVTCAHCGYVETAAGAVVGKKAAEFEFTVETVDQAARGWGEARKELACESCGATAVVSLEDLTHTCAFCSSNKVIQREVAGDQLRPRFLAPFVKTMEDCHKITQAWLGSSWMTPSALKRAAQLQTFRGVYLSFWTFDAVTTADWRAEVGHTETEHYYDASDKTWKTRSKTVWRWESGHVRLLIDDLIVRGASRLSPLHLEKISDYDLRALVDYNPSYLAGLQAQAYDIPLEEAWELGRQQMREKTRLSCRDQASTSQIRNFSMSLDFSEESWRYVLLPVYVAAYRYQEKVYQILVNGQTGAISGPRPVDWTKIWLVAALLALPGLCLGVIGLATLPFGGAGLPIGILGVVVLVIGLVIGGVMLSKANQVQAA